MERRIVHWPLAKGKNFGKGSRDNKGEESRDKS